MTNGYSYFSFSRKTHLSLKHFFSFYFPAAQSLSVLVDKYRLAPEREQITKKHKGVAARVLSGAVMDPSNQRLSCEMSTEGKEWK